MTKAEQTELKIRKLMLENRELMTYIQNIEIEYDVLTDQYMNGNIAGPIGRAQRHLEKLADKHKRKILRNNDKIVKLKQILNNIR